MMCYFPWFCGLDWLRACLGGSSVPYGISWSHSAAFSWRLVPGLEDSRSFICMYAPHCFSMWPCSVTGLDVLTAWLSLGGWTSLQSFWLPQRVFQKDRLHGASAYQASILVTLANVTLTRVSHVAKPTFSVEGATLGRGYLEVHWFLEDHQCSSLPHPCFAFVPDSFSSLIPSHASTLFAWKILISVQVTKCF